MLSVCLWNVQWASPPSKRGAFFTQRFSEFSYDAICVTEGASSVLPEDGNTIASDADYGYAPQPGRRKVLLWSRAPWHDVDQVGSPLLPSGRFVAGTTDTPRGAIRFIGVCIPWRDAHVRTGRRDRAPWEDHLTYLQHLSPLLRRHSGIPTVLLGDFNQRIPRSSQPQHVYSSLIDALPPTLEVTTAGHIENAPGLSIDHVAVSPELTICTTEFLSQYDTDGTPMSDHFGLRIQLR